MSAAQIEYQLRRLASAMRSAAFDGRWAAHRRFEQSAFRLTRKLESMK